MTLNRRRLFWSVLIAAPTATAQQPCLADDRLRPILERRIARLQPLRDFEIDDSISPHAAL